ncbi:MAG: glycosyltransferase [Candidatus Paceibacterota bacterium]
MVNYIKNKEKIPCSVGILTFNSEKTLGRALESLKGFAEIILADGGSTDGTLKIAQEYGCKVIQQSNPGHPIEDFAKERNRTLDASSYDWFFYIDSDEFISDGLREEIGEIVHQENPKHLLYRVKYRKVSPDLKKEYRTFKEYYQIRFFNKKMEARFVKPMHEKVSFNEDKYSIGIIESPWYVVLDTLSNFLAYKRKVDYRIGVMIDRANINSLPILLKAGVFVPIKEIIKSFLKIIYLPLRHGKNAIPVRYELYRIYGEFIRIQKTFTKYFRK